MSGAAFTRTDCSLGELALRPVDPPTDVELLHGWLTHPKARFWQMQGAGLDDVERHFACLVSSPTDQAFVGLHDGAPSFLTERYEPTADHVGERFRARPGDIGMHLLVPHTDRPVHGFTLEVLVTVLDFLFADPRTARVVVEPDVDTTPIHALNAAVGFEVADTASLATKRALVSTCTRERFARARRRGMSQPWRTDP